MLCHKLCIFLLFLASASLVSTKAIITMPTASAAEAAEMAERSISEPIQQKRSDNMMSKQQYDSIDQWRAYGSDSEDFRNDERDVDIDRFSFGDKGSMIHELSEEDAQEDYMPEIVNTIDDRTLTFNLSEYSGSVDSAFLILKKPSERTTTDANERLSIVLSDGTKFIAPVESIRRSWRYYDLTSLVNVLLMLPNKLDRYFSFATPGIIYSKPPHLLIRYKNQPQEFPYAIRPDITSNNIYE